MVKLFLNNESVNKIQVKEIKLNWTVKVVRLEKIKNKNLWKELIFIW
jgi:hypothetical protein